MEEDKLDPGMEGARVGTIFIPRIHPFPRLSPPLINRITPHNGQR
jgi:hypothetical protein